MNIWRINCKPGDWQTSKISQEQSFKKWIEMGIIGIGWSKTEGFLDGIENENQTSEEIKQYILKNLKEEIKSFTTYTNILFYRMKKGDFIWVRCNGRYKLGIVEDDVCRYNIDFIP